MHVTFATALAIMLFVSLTDARAQSPTGTAKGDRANLCGLLSQAEVTHALHVIVVRAEAPETEFPGCEFSIKATQADAGAGHMTEVAKSAALTQGTQLDESTQKLINTFAKGVFQGSDAEKSATAGARHPGEVPVLTFDVRISENAKDEAHLTRQTQANISPKGITALDSLGDEAFDSGGAMLTVRKGDKLLELRYPACACTTQDVVPLARKIVASL